MLSGNFAEMTTSTPFKDLYNITMKLIALKVIINDSAIYVPFSALYIVENEMESI
jgi:hypothetical protein